MRVLFCLMTRPRRKPGLARRRFDQLIVLTLVVGLHLLFLVVVGAGRRPASPGRSAPQPEAMILLNLTPVAPVPQAQQRPHRDSAFKRGGAVSAGSPRAAAVTPTPPAIPAGAAQPPSDSIDWRLQGQITAQAQAVEGIRRQVRECEEARQHGRYPPGCAKDSYDPHWQPQDKTAGFIGIIPYVRLGRRCIVALGFFACNTDGKLPEPDGTLLKDMQDPSRPASSVPQLDGAVPEAPRPQAFKQQE